MKNIILIAIIIAVNLRVYPQNNLESPINYNSDIANKKELLNYFVKNNLYPINIIEDNDISDSEKNRAIEQWNKDNFSISKELNINSYKEYIELKEKFNSKIYTYPPKPKFVDTGNPSADELNFKASIKIWSENHPAYPQRIDTGNQTEDDKVLRKAYLDFYQTYIKEEN